MDSPFLKSVVGKLREWEACADAWAAKRLTADEYGEALKLDRDLKQNFGRWVLRYAAVVAVLTSFLHAVVQKFDWMQAFTVANLLVVGLGIWFVAAWYGYSQFEGARARKSFSKFMLLIMAGGATGFGVSMYERGRSLAELSGERVGVVVGALLMVGGVSFGIMYVIATFRARQARERLALRQAQVKLLQAQVEPHFLFNTLANLRYLVQSGSPEALRMLDHLIHYLRTALPELRAESSTLGREAELARAYLEIMRIRMAGALEPRFEIPDELAATPFPPLMLMTLVENAVKHGISPIGRGAVRVSARRDGNGLQVRVEDDGRGVQGEAAGGLGLANVRERLLALYGVRGKLALAPREGGGTVATIQVEDGP